MSSGDAADMKVIFMAKDRPESLQALDHLLAEGAEVVAVVAPSPGATDGQGSLGDAAGERGLTVAEDADLYAQLEGEERGIDLRDVSLVLSFLFWKKIRVPLIDLPSAGCVNFHPAPLPDFRGVAGYSFAILEQLREWGVSAHYVEESIDTGDLIEVERFPIDPEVETADSLRERTLQHLLGLFREVTGMLLRGHMPTRTPQGEGRYISHADLEAARIVRADDDPETIERKIRAFWAPPHHGAFIRLAGREFTLVSEELLRGEVADRYRR